MKRILIGVLSLAIAAGGIFAQEEKKEGLKISGGVVTGLRFTSEQKMNADGTAEWKDHSMEVWHDDAGVVRLELNGTFTRENYGLVFRVQIKPWEMSKQDAYGALYDLLQQAYVWADFWDKKIRLTGGKIDDSAWGSAGDEGFHYSTGLGLRFEIKPIEALNFGFFLNPGEDPHDNRAFQGGTGSFNPAHGDGVSRHIDNFFKETGFGVKYTHEIVDIAAGLRLDSEWDNLNTKGEHDYDSHKAVTDDSDKGLRFYFGVDVKAVKNLKAAAEVQFYNLGGFDDYGWVWLNEKFSYNLAPLTVGLNMHQYFFGKDNQFTGYWEDGVKEADHSVLPLLTFIPNASYKLGEKWELGLEIPFKIWPEVSFQLELKPKVTYTLGKDFAKISGYYLFRFLQHDKAAKYGKGLTTPDGLFTHAVQINFEWNF